MRFEIYILHLSYRDELKQKKRRKFLSKIFSAIAIKVTVFAAVIYFFFFTDYLRVTDLKIESDENNLASTLRASVEDWLSKTYFGLRWRSNLLLLSSADLRSLLYSKFPAIADLKITKDFPHELNIHATEREHYGTWCFMSYDPHSGPKCYQFDLSGKTYKETVFSTGFLIFTVLDYRPKRVDMGQPGNTTSDVSSSAVLPSSEVDILGQQVIGGNWFSPMVLARDGLAKHGIKFGEFIIPDDSFDEFYVKMPEGTNIFFSISTDVPRQVNALAQFLRGREKNVAPLEYIDLRIQDRIYFK